MAVQLRNSFRVGEIVRAEGARPPGDGFIIPDGEVRPNFAGGHYYDSPNVVLVRGPIASLPPRRVRSRATLETRGVYFHKKDVRVVAESLGTPVTEQNTELAQIADVLDGVAKILSNVEQLRSAKESGRKVRRMSDQLRKLADGN